MTKRWAVLLPGGTVDTVTAETLSIWVNGVACFRTKNTGDIYYGLGQWVRILPAD